jgi:hypothetical protein
VPHLLQINHSISTPEVFTFSYSSGSLGPPFGTDSTYSGLTTTRLTTLGVPGTGAGSYAMTYDTAGASELQSVTFP